MFEVVRVDGGTPGCVFVVRAPPRRHGLEHIWRSVARAVFRAPLLRRLDRCETLPLRWDDGGDAQRATWCRVPCHHRGHAPKDLEGRGQHERPRMLHTPPVLQRGSLLLQLLGLLEGSEEGARGHEGVEAGHELALIHHLHRPFLPALAIQDEFAVNNAHHAAASSRPKHGSPMTVRACAFVCGGARVRLCGGARAYGRVREGKRAIQVTDNHIQAAFKSQAKTFRQRGQHAVGETPAGSIKGQLQPVGQAAISPHA